MVYQTQENDQLDLQVSGTPKSVVASMLGHTEEVNEKYYTYDTSKLDEKKKIVQTRKRQIQKSDMCRIIPTKANRLFNLMKMKNPRKNGGKSE